MEIFDNFDDVINKLGKIDKKKPITHVIFVQDHSGSMEVKTSKDDTKRADFARNNFNEHINKAKGKRM